MLRKRYYAIFMKITIEYCEIWNYFPEATSVAAEIRDGLDVVPELIAGSGGVFIVRCDGNIMYNKVETGVFPLEGAIVELLRR